MILPGFGIISEVLPVFARKPIFGYKAIAAATVVIAFLALLVWAHHMFSTPSPTVVLVFFMISSFLIAIPTGVKIFNWVATLWRGTIEFRTPLLFARRLHLALRHRRHHRRHPRRLPGRLAAAPTRTSSSPTSTTCSSAARSSRSSPAIYYWFPKMTGRMLGEGLGKSSFALMWIGFNVTFLIQHSIGLDGMPRRVYEYPDVGNLELYNLISTIGSFILALGIGVTLVNVVRLAAQGRRRPARTRGRRNTLEWFTQSPPPVNNFDVVPRVRSVEPMKDIRRQVERPDGPSRAARAAGARIGRATRRVDVRRSRHCRVAAPHRAPAVRQVVATTSR